MVIFFSSLFSISSAIHMWMNIYASHSIWGDNPWCWKRISLFSHSFRVTSRTQARIHVVSVNKTCFKVAYKINKALRTVWIDHYGRWTNGNDKNKLIWISRNLYRFSMLMPSHTWWNWVSELRSHSLAQVQSISESFGVHIGFSWCGSWWNWTAIGTRSPLPFT